MTRLLVVASLVVSAALSVGSGIVYARPIAGGLQLSVPASLEAGTTRAVAVRLPARVAAADGRIMFDTSAAEVVGIAPDGKGTALAPEEIPGGVAFGAYGLQARGGQTVLNVVFVAHRDGRMQFRVVIDSVADASGRRVALAASIALGTLSIGDGKASFRQPREATGLAPARAVGTLRDVVSDGRIGKTDLDELRANWERTRANGGTCGITSTADANGDGCVDIVDLQAVSALQGNAAPVQADGSQFAPSSIAADAPIFTVMTTFDTSDARLGDGLCADSVGRCSLRAAISESNWMKGDNRINFNLTGTAPVRIQLVGDLPIVQDRSGATFVDGYSQPGASVNTLPYGSNAVAGVEVRGTTGSSRGNAFRMTSANNTIRGFLLTAHYRPIFIDGPDAHHNEILGNLIGFTRTGAVDGYRGDHGVRLNVGAHDNKVGSPTLADRNVIGNFTHAVDLYGPGTDSNTVQNNVLCMTPSGNGGATCSTAIDHNFGPKNNLNGGTDPSERNYIGPTTLNGIEISHGWDPNGIDTTTKWQLNYNRIIGNWIGFRGDGNYDAAFRSGQSNPGSADNGNGVNVYDGSNFNLVEGNWVASVYDGIQTMSPNSTGNIIRGNMIGQSPLGQPAPVGRYGINVRGNTKSHVIEGNTIRNAGIYGIALTQKNVLWIRLSRNIITDMSGPAIYLAPDPNDPSQGANNLLKAPVVTSATTVRANGTGIPGATVEIYKASRPAGQSGLPEQYLGSAVVAANGTWTTPIVVAAGDRVVGLQIDPANNTSALGTNVAATFEAPPQKPVADFTWSQRAGTLAVDFTDASTNSPAQWSWTLGDGTTSTAQNPSKTYAAAGTYSVSLSATNGGGTDSITKTIAVQPLPAGTTYAADGFGRTVSGWGNADIGGAYTLQGTTSNYAVGNGVGTMQFLTANSSRAALLNGASQLDVDVQFRVKADKVAQGGSYTVYAVTRRTGTYEYRPRIIFNANGTISVNASVVNNNAESSLGSPVVVPGLVQVANSFVLFRAQVTGANPTTIRVKAWADGQAEPAGWNFTVTNSLAAVQVAGSLGLRCYVGSGTNAPVVLTFDDYAVRSPS